MRINEGSNTRISAFLPESITTSSGSPEDDSSTTSDTAPPLTQLSTECCIYRGEGNANIVIALPHEHKVIRFRKSLPGEVSPYGGKVRVEREVEFVRNVVSCFLGSYVQTPEILRFDMKDIARFSEAIRPFRPEKRRHKEISDEYATKFPDYTFLPATKLDYVFRNKSTFCVEIKPKQGYLPKGEQQFQKCTYCLTQYYKLKKKVITNSSRYCPFDLFSGEQERMKFALQELLKSPQNNLKIFKDGIVVYDQESCSSDLERVLSEWFRNSVVSTKETYCNKFCNLVCTALLRPFAQEESKPSSSHKYNPFPLPVNQDLECQPCINPDIVAKAKKLLYFAREECNFDSQGLPKDSVLERILRMQRLPCISTEYIYNIYSKFSTLLNDEIAYFNVIKSHRLFKGMTSQDTIIGNQEKPKEKYARPYCKNYSVLKRKYDDANENQSLKDDLISYTNNEEKNHNLNFISQSDSFPTQWRNDTSYNCKSGIKGSNKGTDYDEAKACNLITAENLVALQNYLLFSTARDCSILMAFRELDSKMVPSVHEENIIKISQEHYFLSNIGVSDLDPKSVHCIGKHRQRDIDVLNSVIFLLEEELALKNQRQHETQIQE